ncbi:BREX-2 system phosphatase PglZ [Kribbella sp. NPDC023855]|uniref:BREX-2 system phosphatase PglZ n=1 Tax=Kribbella sp. NPDC023855 TaxID=3154698 RepID=UPI0033E65AA3
MTATVAATPVSPSMVLAIVDEARDKDYSTGVIGLRGVPDRAVIADLQHDGRVVRVRPAESALAVREVLTEHREGDWMVVITDRADDDLGAGVLAHFIWQRLRSPDPWEAVRHRFAATGIDPALTGVHQSRELASALLAATPTSGWPAAPAGVLTRSHALTSVARIHLGLDSDTADVLGVLRWTMRPASVTAVADLRAEFGNRLADETLDWIADRAGAASQPVRILLRQGEMADLVPLGTVIQLLTADDVLTAEERHVASTSLVRIEPRWGGEIPPVPALRALGSASTELLTELAGEPRQGAHVERALQRAGAILNQVQGEQLSAHSDLLKQGQYARLSRLCDALAAAIAPDPAPTAGRDVEAAWSLVRAHFLSRPAAPLTVAFAAAVRLSRWLLTRDGVTRSELLALTRRHMDQSAWVDAAINDVHRGVEDPHQARYLGMVAEAAMDRRKAEEREFATVLAHATRLDGVLSQAIDPTVWPLEAVLPGVVIPMARKAPLLLFVMDGMSAAVATEIVEDATDRLEWLEAELPVASAGRRAAGLSVLPSLTEVSRASLLCGRLRQGQQDVERRGYEELTAKAGKIKAALFHKKGVDSTAAGSSVSADVSAAIDDRTIDLVTVVLNTIDDALDRSDPAGTTWTADAVKHLEPILARARAAGRTVVITADHGHVVERRRGTQRSYVDITSGRSRAVTGTVEDGEIEVSGDRVLTPDHRAILAVDEDLRYGPLKAGYHGGASAAEVVVPIAVLVPDEDSNPLGLALLPPQVPTWWLTQENVAVEPVPAPRPLGTRDLTRTSKKSRPDLEPTLFDEVDPPEAPTPTQNLGDVVVRSEVYRAQRRVAGRLIVKDEQVAALVDALAVAAATRLPMTIAARALSVNETRLRGALAQVQQLLNVEGYAVIGTDPHTSTVVLDERLLREQFEVR